MQIWKTNRMWVELKFNQTSREECYTSATVVSWRVNNQEQLFVSLRHCISSSNERVMLIVVLFMFPNKLKKYILYVSFYAAVAAQYGSAFVAVAVADVANIKTILTKTFNQFLKVARFN
ncbi:hypothetical protein GQX74_009582 [Glossina fuscipes]|nr:hypothetical protein GQX74_009582 [Glossina fuscipes]